MLMNQHLLSKRRKIEKLPSWLAVNCETGGFVRSAIAFEVLAGTERRATLGAVGTMTTEDGQASNDMVARFDIGDVRPNCFYYAGRFMPENGWGHVRVFALHEVKVAVAEPGR
jgi:hypothetical protein